MFSLQTNLNDQPAKIRNRAARQEEDLREEVDVENPLKPCLFTSCQFANTRKVK